MPRLEASRSDVRAESTECAAVEDCGVEATV